MGQTFGEIRTVPASDEAKAIMSQLKAKGIAKEARDIWQLGAALGIAAGEFKEVGSRDTFQNINSLDPEEAFAAVMLGRYPEMTAEQRLKRLADHAEWGIRELQRREANGTLKLSQLATGSEARNERSTKPAEPRDR